MQRKNHSLGALILLTWWSLLLATLTFTAVIAAAAQETLRIPLSGKGPADAVEWDFQVSAGRRAGEDSRAFAMGAARLRRL